MPIDPSRLDLKTLRDNAASMSPAELAAVAWRLEWLATARPNQVTPDGNWLVWFLMAGRGFGKTRVGAEDVGWHGYSNPGSRIAILAPTSGDVRDTCFEGESGLLSVIPSPLIDDYHRSLGELVLKNKTRFKGFSAEEPERLRGPQHHRAWCDELGAWQNAQATWDMLMFGLRLGEHPQVVVTSTPKPVDIVRTLVRHPKTKVTIGTTYENRANLASSFFDQIVQYEGTRIGRQEIYAELIDLEEAGIFKRSGFKMWPARKPLPDLDLVIQSWDTAYTKETHNDPTACTTWGAFRARNGENNVILLDAWGDHIEYPVLRERVKKEYKCLYGPTNRRVDIVLVEAKGSGISLLQDLRMAGIPARPYNPGRADKVQRAHAVSHLSGLVWVPESDQRPGRFRLWAEPFLDEVCSFPASARDDYTDTFTQMLTILRDMLWLKIDKTQNDFDSAAEPERVSNPYAA